MPVRLRWILIGCVSVLAIVQAASSASGAGILFQASFRATGAGATDRSAMSKLRDTVSVKDFGAVCNDVADDITAFNAALTAAATVFVPEGTCLISSTLSIPTNKRLFGSGGRHAGTTIHYTGSGVAISISSADSVTLNAVKINAPNATDGLKLNDATRFNSADLLIVGPPAIGIHLTSTSGGDFWNYFENFEVNTAVLPLKIEKGGASTNEHMFNHGILRTSAAANGTVGVLSGTGDNTFTDVDASNYGTGTSKSWDIQTGSVNNLWIGGLIDTAASNTGFTIAAGVAGTKVFMGDIGAGVAVSDQSLSTTGVFFYNAVNNIGGLQFQGTYPAASAKLAFNDAGNISTSQYIQAAQIRLKDESGGVDRFKFNMGSGNLETFGKYTTYNNVATAGYGVATVHGTPVLLTAQTANLGATNVYASAPVGEYEVCATARTTTSGTGTTANLNIIWTDEGGVKTDAVGTWALNSVTVTGQINKCEYIHAAAASNIQVSVTAGTYGTSVYAISATAERLN